MRTEEPALPDPPRPPRRIVLAALLAAACALFAALGLWQVERRGEKLALIEAVGERVHAAPVGAPGPGEWGRSFEGDAYRRVRVRGEFLHDRETLVQATTRLGTGYWVVTPLRTEAGWTVLVNRGFVPFEKRDRAARRAGEPRGPVTVTGLLRTTEPKGAWLRANNPARGRWYSRDVAAIGQARGLERLAPYFIDAGREGGTPGQPMGGLTVLSFPNNHLQYALTWFALAGLSAFGLARVWRGRMRRRIFHPPL